MIDIELANKEFSESMIIELQKAAEYSKSIKFKKVVLDFKNNKILHSQIENLENVIYIIKIKDDCNVKAETICTAINGFKGDGNVNIKFPKVNNCAENSENKILYVGKSKGKIKGRFISHLTSNSPSVYGLHLEYWKNNPILNELELDLYYAQIDLNPEDNDYDILELLETALHKKYKPILGRSGH